MTNGLPLLGFGLPVAGAWATPATMRHVAGRAEGLGYASLWTFQRLLDPVGAGLAETHRSVHDALVPLAFVAGSTERIGLGTATICAPFVPPPVLAQAYASLDVVSGGRVTVGIGMGWLPAEYAAAGVPFERRGARFEEYLRTLVAVWTQDPVEVAGEFYRVPRSHVAPAPVQRPHPPVLVGGTAPAALRRAGRLAQGWIVSSRHDLDGLRDGVELVRAGAREAGRDPERVRVLLRAVVDLTDTPVRGDRRPFHGSVDQVLGDLEEARACGVTEAFVDLNLLTGVGAVDADPAEALAYADHVLDTFAPAALA